MKWIFSLVAALVAGSVMAHPAYLPDAVSPGCHVTPRIKGAEAHYPGMKKVIRCNKLIRPAGKAEDADGQPLIFGGRVVDERCIPVQGAHVELWQADAMSKYGQASAAALGAPDAVFAGSGKAVSNNRGEFRFETVFPGAVKGRAPRLQLRIAHPELKTLTTELFFENDHRNAKDAKFSALGTHEQQRVLVLIKPAAPLDSQPYAPLHGYAELVLKGSDKFTGF